MLVWRSAPRRRTLPGIPAPRRRPRPPHGLEMSGLQQFERPKPGAQSRLKRSACWEGAREGVVLCIPAAVLW